MKKTVLTLALAIVSLCSFTQELKTDIKAIAAKYKAVGVAYAVVKNGKIIHTDAIGYKNLSTKEPLDAKRDIFRIASISKSFTATALMQLVEQGKISLDDDFGTLVGFPIRNPKFPDTPITLRMVLSHTSSINDVNGYFDLDVINPTKNVDWAKSYNTYEPGTAYEYCNLNFNMAGAVLEKLTGVRFDEYIQQQILKPLELYGGYCVDSLDNSRFVPLYAYQKATDSFEEQTAAYNPRSEEIKNYKMGQSTPIFSPTGGMKISAYDLAQYMIMHMNYGKAGKQRLLSKKTAKLMQTKLSEKEGYGLALREVENFVPGYYMVGHTGGAYGLYSSMFFNPKDRFGVVVITNGCMPVYNNGNLALYSELTTYLKKYFLH